ncbi:alpha/beta fold hydrolase [Pedobacter sp. SYSU D00535]|uniref:alpha/beta fold hydrolase n=1 Tax=Pedobacter sp. SYSU D00535 TaxID=2810308 RepID=UPI001A95820A|nr:alpha/beta hydrolase [Pedobacter sp. SYSU D00535]
METKQLSEKPTIHLVTGLGAAALAAGPLRKTKAQSFLFSVAVQQLLTWYFTSKRDAAKKKLPIAVAENSKSADVNGIRMRWEEHGTANADGVPVVLVHGLPTNPRVWRYVIPNLTEKKRQCLAYELVGFGWSMKEGCGRDISVAAQAEYLYQWLQYLGVSKAVFVAHDLGGAVVQRLAANKPELFAGLVLIDSASPDNLPATINWITKFAPGGIDNLSPTLLNPLFKGMMASLGHSSKVVKHESLKLFWAPYNWSGGPKALAHQLHDFQSAEVLDTAEVLKSVELSIPKRVIWGEQDPLGLESATLLANALKAPLITIPQGKHFAVEDHAGVVSRQILELLDELENRASV